MELWMKAALGLLVVALIAVAAMLAVNLTRERAVFTYPFPDLERWQLELTCVAPYNGRPAQENADLSYAAYLEHVQRGRPGPRPSVEEFSTRGADALQAADRLLQDLESDYGCTVDILR